MFNELARVTRNPHDNCLNPIHGGAASNVQSNHEGSTNFRQKRKRLASLKERIHGLMNNDTTYAMLVQSEEKGRSIMETAVYARSEERRVGKECRWRWSREW